ncbi:HigA family addiction module antitoxin [Ensifer sp. 2YAB10]|uniref:HigA family addiction module antitoxin n=1 Tax=Ensifer sp. 2YAB10 TaxID=3233021 RepID=UPI003F90AB3E
MGVRIPAEVFPPGEFLKDELEARGWTQAEFAEIIGKDARLVSEVISGKRSVTPETAIALGAALGTTPELWMNLEGQYQLSKVRPKEDTIARKADLHGRFPVREMVKRGWIEATKSVDVLQQQLLDFFGIATIEEEPQLRYAAKSATYREVPVTQVAWFCRAKKLANLAPAGDFSAQRLTKAQTQLREQLAHTDGTQRVPGILAQAGIRFVIVEAISGSKIDGACFWLDKNSPVIAMSMRFDRVDNFWHTLFHELDHIVHKEGQAAPILDVDIMDPDSGKPDIEVRANENAAEALIPKAEMDGFIARVNPMFSEEQIIGFARRISVHPGLVVGQLQNRRLIPWSFHRKHLEKVRDYVVVNALTDGFGRQVAETFSH